MATVQVYADAQVDLLLGTDVQPQLGLVLLALKSNEKAQELFQERLGDVSRMMNLLKQPLLVVNGNMSTMEQIATSHKTPCKFCKDNQNQSVRQWPVFFLFEPDPQFLNTHQLRMTDAVVEPNIQQEVRLIIENCGLQSLKLKKNTVLGHVIPADIVKQIGTEEPGTDEAVPMVAKLTTTPVDPEHLLRQ